MGVGAAEGDGGALGGEDGGVEVALGVGEAGENGEGAGYVGDVVGVFLEEGGMLGGGEGEGEGKGRERGHTPPASTRTRSPSFRTLSLRT